MLRLVTSQGSPYPSRSPRAHRPAGLIDASMSMQLDNAAVQLSKLKRPKPWYFQAVGSQVLSLVHQWLVQLTINR